MFPHVIHLYVKFEMCPQTVPMCTTSLNPVPNAHVCVFDGTHYKIITTNYISMYPSGPWPLKILMFALPMTCELSNVLFLLSICILL
jgi:hypothetical protein